MDKFSNVTFARRAKKWQQNYPHLQVNVKGLQDTVITTLINVTNFIF